MGHVGLTPQSVHRMGGHRVQGRRRGRGPGERERVMADAVAVEDAGAFAVVLEGIPLDLAGEITERLSIPTIGIGAGVDCDGQILVLHDVLGLFERLHAEVREALRRARRRGVAAPSGDYVDEVRSGVVSGRGALVTSCAREDSGPDRPARRRARGRVIATA